MDTTEFGVLAQAQRSTKSTPSRAQRLLRNLESLCQRRTKRMSDPAPQSHFQAYRERHKLTRSERSCSEPQQARPISPECSPPDFRPFSIALGSVTTFDHFDDRLNHNDDDFPDAGHAASEAQRVSGLRSYRLGQANRARAEEDDEAISPMTPANPKTKDKTESRKNEHASPSRRDSLLTNLRCLQSRMSTHEEKIGLLLRELVGDPVVRGQNDKLKRESGELRKKSDNHIILVNLVKLYYRISALAILLENLKTEPDLAFYTMAWLAVHQMNDLESTTKDLLSSMEKNGMCDGKANLSVISSAGLSHQASVNLSKIAKEVNQRCELLITKLEKLGLEAKMPKRTSIQISACASCGKET